MNRIHWKLSSKKDEFIVKEYSLPIDVPCVLFLDMKCYKDDDYTLPVFDTLVETLLSVSRFLIENERIHKIIFYNAKYREFAEHQIDSPEKLRDVTNELILSVNDNLYCASPEDYFAENNLGALSSFTFITSSPDTEVLEYINDEVDSDLKNSIVIVKDADEAVKWQADYSEMSLIPVAVGRISASIKDIEI